MSLEEYERKRDFRKTKEPRGNTANQKSGKQFVIQKHAARRLHYDFRLELNGVLKSWAVPKGPSFDPAIKALAVHVEDHPLEYASFEGIIPEDQYGGGTVMVWDRGTWEPIGDAAKSYKKGKLKFTLKGEKLRGEWTLVRMSGRSGAGGKNWLLIKSDDEEAIADDEHGITEREPESVATGRSLKQIANNADRIWNSEEGKSDKPAESLTKPKPQKRTATKNRKDDESFNVPVDKATRAKKAPQPPDLSPQLATLADKVPEGDRWLHELKLDGYRILAHVDKGTVRLMTRNGKDWTKKFSPLAKAFARLKVERAIFDGEVVALDENGGTDFQKLQNSLKRGNKEPLICYCFDLPYCNGYDLTRTPLGERKELLARIVLGHEPNNNGTLRYSDHICGKGSNVIEHACRLAMEGVISKKFDSPYVQSRSRYWLKIKCLQRQEFVIGGYTKPSGSRVGFGALLLGYYDADRLIYCGRVGTGFTHDSLRQVARELQQIEADQPPFVEPPTGAQAKGVTWVEPKRICEVEFNEWTSDGMLRHPSFQGLREDKPPRDVVRERPSAIPNGTAKTKSRSANSKTKSARSAATSSEKEKSSGASIAGVALSHPDRVLFPTQDLTKRDLANFYEKIADAVLPHLVNRPLSLVRCPKGRSDKCFYQKHLSGSHPDSLGTIEIREKEKQASYPVITDLSGLISLVQMGVLEIHPWPARVDRIDRPDRIVFDLDPGQGTGWNDVIRAARDVHAQLEALSLDSYVRTSGGKGLHVVVPIERRSEWDDLKGFAKAFAERLVEKYPDRYTATMSKSKRQGKIFIDYLRNQRGATAVASYSTRAREGAPVATPIRWDELASLESASQYGVANLPNRLSSLASDPWNGFFSLRQSITRKKLQRLAEA